MKPEYKWAHRLIDEAMYEATAVPHGQVFLIRNPFGGDVENQRSDIAKAMIFGLPSSEPDEPYLITGFLHREGRLPTPEDDKYQLAVARDRLLHAMTFDVFSLISEVDLIERSAGK